LIQKKQKIKTKRFFRPQAKHPGPRFLSGIYPLLITIHLKCSVLTIFFLLDFPSVEQLRVKSGKTMVALSAKAGHSRFLQQGRQGA